MPEDNASSVEYCEQVDHDKCAIARVVGPGEKDSIVAQRIQISARGQEASSISVSSHLREGALADLP